MIEIDIAVSSGLHARCQRDDLVPRLSIVARALSARSAVHILGGILLRAEGGELQLAATDMELSLRTSLAAEIASEGSVVVPGRLLLEIARVLPDAEVEIVHQAEDGLVSVRCGASSWRLHTYAAEDFPRLPELEGLSTFSVAREALLETIARVSRSASRDESRPVLTGILVRFDQDKLVMAATDSYRLASKTTPLTGDAPDLEAIIPARALVEL